MATRFGLLKTIISYLIARRQPVRISEIIDALGMHSLIAEMVIDQLHECPRAFHIELGEGPDKYLSLSLPVLDALPGIERNKKANLEITECLADLRASGLLAANSGQIPASTIIKYSGPARAFIRRFAGADFTALNVPVLVQKMTISDEPERTRTRRYGRAYKRRATSAA